MTAEQVGTGAKRSVAAESDGSFRIGALPTGTYKVTFTDASGKSRTEQADVTLGSSTEVSGDVVRYVVNRNINYTNVCGYKCTFCAFSKGTHARALRGTRVSYSCAFSTEATMEHAQDKAEILEVVQHWALWRDTGNWVPLRYGANTKRILRVRYNNTKRHWP